MAAQQKYENSDTNSSHQCKSTLSGERDCESKSTGNLLHGKNGDEEKSDECGIVMATHEDDIGEVLEHTDTMAKNSVCLSNSYSSTYHSEVSGENDNILAVKGETHIAAGFDLNEDISTNATGGCTESDALPLSSNGVVIRVTARAGKPYGSPMIPLRFEGQMGWTGSTRNSAFRRVTPSSTDRRTCSRVNNPKKRKLFSGIDLNASSVEDNVSNGSPFGNSEVFEDTRKTERLEIDLNSTLCDIVDDPVQSMLSLKPPGDSHIIDLNLNMNISPGVMSNNIHWPGRGHQFSRNETPNTGKQEFSFTEAGSHADLTTMQQQQQYVVNHNARDHQYLLAIPYVVQQLRETSPSVSNALHTQNYYIPDNQTHFGSRDEVPSSVFYPGTLPRVTYSQEQGFFPPQVLYPGIDHQCIKNLGMRHL